MKHSRRFSWPLESNSGNDIDMNESVGGKYVDIDNINLLVKLQYFVDDFIQNDIEFCEKGIHCRVHCRQNHRLKSSPRIPSPHHSYNGLIQRYRHNFNNNSIDINAIKGETNGFNTFKVPIVKNIISRMDSSSLMTTTSSSETTTSCSSCKARESLSSNGSTSSSYSHNVIANDNVMSCSMSSRSDSEIISNISGFSDGPVNHNSDVLLPDEVILRELSEMRALLEQILQNREQLGPEWNHANTDELLNLFGFTLSDTKHLDLKETSPHYPMGPWEYQECGVCLEVVWLYKRYCCNYCACISCLRQYYTSRIEFGAVSIECINPLCHSYVHRDEISARLSPQMKEVYHRLLLTSNQSDQTKPCPQCNYFYTLSEETLKQMRSKYKEPTIFRVQCIECQFFWCFKCHSPWHTDLTCKQYRKGDRLLKVWAKETNHGQVNAQRCPRCSVYIQRTSGCDHMHCTRCKTDFCYKCGDKLRRLKFFGDHYSKLSIFGCKFRYKADKPLQRRLIRGAVFGSKVMLVPVLGSLALCAGAVVVVLGVAALPLYGTIKIYRKYKDKQNLKNIRQQITSISSSVTNID